MNNGISTGLWKKQSQKGTTYFGGTIKIGNTEYYVNVFKNNDKKKENSPDINLLLKEKKPKQAPGEVQQNVIQLLNDSKDPFQDFSNEVELKDIDLPF